MKLNLLNISFETATLPPPSGQITNSHKIFSTKPQKFGFTTMQQTKLKVNLTYPGALFSSFPYMKFGLQEITSSFKILLLIHLN